MASERRNCFGRRRRHHAHEISDPYADGWDARERVMNVELARAAGHCVETPWIGNPYRKPPTKLQTAAHSEAQARSAALWDEGWTDRGEWKEADD